MSCFSAGLHAGSLKTIFGVLISQANYTFFSWSLSWSLQSMPCCPTGLLASLPDGKLWFLFTLGRRIRSHSNFRRLLCDKSSVGIKWKASSFSISSHRHSQVRDFKIVPGSKMTPRCVGSGAGGGEGAITHSIARPLKIVHPIKHRQNFRPWMNRVGVALPWIDGILMGVPLLTATTGFDRQKLMCRALIHFVSPTAQKVCNFK